MRLGIDELPEALRPGEKASLSRWRHCKSRRVIPGHFVPRVGTPLQAVPNVVVVTAVVRRQCAGCIHGAAWLDKALPISACRRAREFPEERVEKTHDASALFMMSQPYYDCKGSSQALQAFRSPTALSSTTSSRFGFSSQTLPTELQQAGW